MKVVGLQFLKMLRPFDGHRNDGRSGLSMRFYETFSLSLLKAFIAHNLIVTNLKKGE
jgi:hypothetical protein